MTLRRLAADLIDLCRLRHLDGYDRLLGSVALGALLLASTSAFAAAA